MNNYNVLIARLQNELQKIDTTFQSALSQAQKAKRTAEFLELCGI
jgi:hypothetical protein